MSAGATSGRRIPRFLPWLLLVVSFVGAWATWQYMRPRVQQDLPTAVQRWAEILAEEGVRVDPGLVRATSPVPGFIYNAIYTESASARVSYLQWFDRPDAARAQAERLQRMPDETTARAAGVFVLRLPQWPPGDDLTRRVQARFEAFAKEQGQPDPAPSH